MFMADFDGDDMYGVVHLPTIRLVFYRPFEKYRKHRYSKGIHAISVRNRK